MILDKYASVRLDNVERAQIIKRGPEACAPDDRIDCHLRAIRPDNTARGHPHEGTHGYEITSGPRLPDRRHHHDIAYPPDGGLTRPCLHSGDCAIEQNAAVYIVWQE